ncbi:MAG: hypothetical protein WCH43_13410, partial [Verrucomicrobiota bacterium]
MSQGAGCTVPFRWLKLPAAVLIFTLEHSSSVQKAILPTIGSAFVGFGVELLNVTIFPALPASG